MARQDIVTWLEARSRLDDAEERLLQILSNAEKLAKSLRISNAERFAKPLQDWRSPPFEPNNWPDASTVEAAMQACRDTHRALVDADRKLSAADRKLLRPLAG